MATLQQFLACDSSTLANFKAWASAISAFFATAGWMQSTDTGQVNWGTISTVPAASSYVYEVWEPNDGLTNFFVKIEYGNASGTAAQPSIRLTLCTSTNGAGTATGFIVGPTNTSLNGITANATALYECDFSGAAGRIGVMMWRNGTGNDQQLFAIERSLNSSGVYTSAYVTLWTAGQCTSGQDFSQRSLVFGVGPGPNLTNNSFNAGGWQVRLVSSSTNNGSANAFNGAIAFDAAAPSIPYLDNACTVVGAGNPGDFAEGVPFTVTMYSSTRTFMPSKNGPFGSDARNTGNSNGLIAMRYD
jgi:hypothetical protein